MINICPNCKGIVGSDTVFCTKCGANIKTLKNKAENISPINSNTVDFSKDDIIHSSEVQDNRSENKENLDNTSKVSHKYRFRTIAVMCWLIAIALVVFGILLPIPEKHIDTWQTFVLNPEWEGDKYTEYVGGDAYNIIIEASLRGGIIAGRTVAKTILIVSGIVFCFAGAILTKIESDIT